MIVDIVTMDKCLPISLISQESFVGGKELIPADKTVDVTKTPFNCVAFLWVIAVFFVPGALMGKSL